MHAMMAPEHRTILLYVLKCVSGCALLLLLRFYQPEIDISWILISMLLVLSPDEQEIIPLTVIRVKANLIGSATAIIFLLLTGSVPMALCLAIFVTIIACYKLALMTGVRPALAAVAIILLHPQGTHLWSTPYERIAMVAAGCLLAFILTCLFHRRLLRPNQKPQLPPASQINE